MLPRSSNTCPHIHKTVKRLPKSFHAQKEGAISSAMHHMQLVNGAVKSAQKHAVLLVSKLCVSSCWWSFPSLGRRDRLCPKKLMCPPCAVGYSSCAVAFWGWSSEHSNHRMPLCMSCNLLHWGTHKFPRKKHFSPPQQSLQIARELCPCDNNENISCPHTPFTPNLLQVHQRHDS